MTFNIQQQVNFGSVTMVGDVTGNSGINSVVKLNGNPIALQSLGASSDGYVLTWDNTDGYWKAEPTLPPLLPFYGEISVQDAVSSQTLTTQNTYYVISQWTTNQNGYGITPNYSAGTLTVNNAGWYITNMNCSMSSANNLTFKAAIFVNGTIHGNGKSQFSTSGISGTPTINWSISDFNHYNQGDVLDIRVECTTGSNIQFSVLQANFYLAST